MQRLIVLLFLILNSAILPTAHGKLTDYLYSVPGTEVRVDIDGDSENGPYFFIRVPAELGTGEALYLYDRVPGTLEGDDIYKFLELLSSGNAQRQLDPRFIKKLTRQDQGDHVNLYLFSKKRDTSFNLPGLDLRVPFYQTITKGQVKTQEYRVNLRDILRSDHDKIDFLSEKLFLQFMLKYTGDKHLFDPEFDRRRFGVQHLEELDDCMDALISSSRADQ